MPNLKRLVEGGAVGDLESVCTPETPTAWSSFMTGLNPGKHGVFDFLVFDPKSGRERPVNSRIRAGKPFWDYLSEAGKTSLVLNVPTTYPPSPVNGAMVCGFLTPEGARDFTYPLDLADRLESKHGKYPLYFHTMCYLAIGSGRHAESLLNELFAMTETKFDVADELFDEHDPDFTMLHIWGTDRLQHELWYIFDQEHPQYSPRMAKRFGQRIDDYYHLVDERLGRLTAKLGDDGVAFVISDHGFGPTHYLIDQNSWLLREGFIKLKPGFRVRAKKALWNLGFTPYNIMRLCNPLLKLTAYLKATPPEALLSKVTGTISIPGMLGFKDVDWEKTVAYAPFGWSGIFINTKGIRPNGCVEPEDYGKVQQAVLDRWAELRNPMNGELVGGPIPTNAEMFSGPYAPYGPDLLPLPLGSKYMPVCFFGFASGEPVYPNHTVPGNHRMEGILAAHGTAIKPGEIAGARLLDMAPTILHLLGEPVHSCFDGKVLTGLLTEAELGRGDVRVAEDDDETPQAAGEDLSEEEQAEIRKRLSELGYL